MKFAAAILLMLIPGAVAQHMLDLDEEGSKDRRLVSHTSQFTNPANAPAENGTCGDPDPNTDNTTDYMCPAGYSTKSASTMGNCSSVDACNENCCNMNSCVCANGVSVTNGNVLSALCVTNGGNVCNTCNAGFHKVGSNCVANTCTCGNGTAATGTACTTNNAEICANCDTGYSVTAGMACNAPNVPDVNGTCADPDPNFAGSVGYICPAGYTNNNPATPTGMCDSESNCIANCCTLNVCTCTNGNAATGADCTSNGAAICASCSTGYNLASMACSANTCTCTNGAAATGTACTTNNAAICATCSAGYNLAGSACSANTCTCSGGTAATGAACTANNAAICTVCNTGYTLVSGACTMVSTPDTTVNCTANSSAPNCTTAAPKATTSEASGLQASLLLTFACAFAAFAMLK